MSIIADVGSMNVKMSLDSAQFTQSMTGINAKLRALRSEMNVARSGGRDFERSLEGMRQKSGILTQTLETQRIKVGQLKDQYEESVRTKGKDATETLRLESAYNNATAQMNRTEGQLKALNAEIRLQESPWQKLSKSLEDAGKKLQDVGGKMKDVGKDMSMKVTTPIVAMGGLMLKTGIDFESSMSKVGAISGATGNDLEKLEAQARDLGATTVYSASEAAEGMSYLAMAGFETNEIMGSMPALLDLAASSNMDLGRAADIASNILTGFGLEADQSGRMADVLAKSASSANTDVGQLGEAMSYVAPVAEGAGLSMEETAAAIGILSDAGIQGGRAGTALRKTISSLQNPTGATKVALDELGLSMKDVDPATNSLSEILGKLDEAGMDSAQAMQLVGEQAGPGLIALLKQGEKGLDKFTDELENSEGAAAKMAETMQDNAAGKMKELRSALEEVSIALSNHLIPYVTAATEKLTGLVRKFGELNPSTQKTILVLAGIAAAIGPVLVVVGTLASSLGAVLSVLGTVTGAIAVVTTGAAAATPAIGALATAFTILTGPVGLIVAGLGAVAAGAFFAIKKGSEDAIEPVQRFGDEVSEATQEAVGAYMDLSEQADVALKELAWSQETVTEEMADNMVEQQAEITSSLMDAINDRHQQEKDATVEQLDHLEGLSEETRKRILDNTDEHFEQEKELTEESNDRINEIYELAAEEKRAITEEESEEILGLRQDMTEQAVVMMSENEMEQKLILEQMKDNSSTITALEAAEVVQNSKEKKENVIADAHDQYDETHAWAIRQRDELGTISEEEADEIIAEAKRQRDGSIEHAEDMHTNVVNEAKEQAGEHVDQVDWETGEVLSKWQVFKNNVGQKYNEIKDDAKDKFSKMWTNTKATFTNLKNDATDRIEEMKRSISTKFNGIKNDAKNKFEEVKNNVTKPVNDAKDTISGIIDDIKGFFSNMKLEIPSIKLPKLPKPKIKGGFSLTPPRVPTISWNAMGGIFTRPTIFNTANAGLQGVGEAGPEAILPLNNKVLGTIGKAIAQATPENKQRSQDSRKIDELIDTLNLYTRRPITTVLKINGREFASATVKDIDEALAREASIRNSFLY